MRLGQLALTLAVTWFIVTRVGVSWSDLRSLDAGDLRPDARLLVVASLVLLAAYVLSAAIWGRIVRDLGGPPVGLLEAVRVYMVANLGRYVPGKVWQVAGLAALARGRGIPAAVATGAAVLGQGIALVAAAGIGALALATGPERYARWGAVGLAALASLVAVSCIPAVFRRVADLWFRLSRTEAPPTIGSVHGLRWLGLYLANWCLYALSFWVLTRSFGLVGAVLPVASAFAAAYVLGYVMVFAPAGLGPREGFLIAFLTPHFGAAPSGMIAVVARLWTTLLEVVPAGLLWARRRRLPADHVAATSSHREVP